VASLFCATLISAQTKPADRHPIDVQKSTLTVHVGKSGLFSGFAHAHDISAPIREGSVETSDHPSVEFRLDAMRLRVLDRDVSEKDRDEIQQTMLGPEVLDSQRFPEIAFKSTAAKPEAQGRWTVHGDLSLHGVTRAVEVPVTTAGSHYQGRVTIRQSSWGIEPIRIAGGAVKVADEVRIDFDIALTP
jgi:polyisoprenoid-binding protein YceI